MGQSTVEEVLTHFEKDYKERKDQYKDALSALAFVLEDYHTTIQMGPEYKREIKKKAVSIAKREGIYTGILKEAIEKEFR